jgi:hypothetical protein
MNLLDPKIGRKTSPLIHGISKERKDFILNIAESASDWQDFEARLNSGGFPLAMQQKNKTYYSSRTFPRKNFLLGHRLR